MFAFLTKFEVEIQGGTVRCHKLSGKQLRKAAEAQVFANIARARAMGGELFKAMREIPPTELAEARAEYDRKKAEKAADLKERAEERYGEYDPPTVLIGAIESWTFAEPVSEANIEALSEEDVETLHRAILDKSLRPLDPKVNEEKEGKDSGPSTSS